MIAMLALDTHAAHIECAAGEELAEGKPNLLHMRLPNLSPLSCVPLARVGAIPHTDRCSLKPAFAIEIDTVPSRPAARTETYWDPAHSNGMCVACRWHRCHRSLLAALLRLCLIFGNVAFGIMGWAQDMAQE